MIVEDAPIGHRPLHRPARRSASARPDPGPAVVSEPGGLDCGGVCVGFFTDGQTVTLSAVPSGHSTFAGSSGAGCSGTDVCEVEAGEADDNGHRDLRPRRRRRRSPTPRSPSSASTPDRPWVGRPEAAQVTELRVRIRHRPPPTAPSVLRAQRRRQRRRTVAEIGANLTDLRPGRPTTSASRATNARRHRVRRRPDASARSRTPATPNEALCPRPVSPAEPSTRSARKGFVVRKKGRCVKRKATVEDTARPRPGSGPMSSASHPHDRHRRPGGRRVLGGPLARGTGRAPPSRRRNTSPPSPVGGPPDRAGDHVAVAVDRPRTTSMSPTGPTAGSRSSTA